MLLTTLLFSVLLVSAWKVKVWKAAAIAGVFFLAEIAFFGANMVKLGHGGWIPLALAAGIYTLMVTWKQGQRIVFERLRSRSVGLAAPVEEYVRQVERENPPRVPRTAVFLERFPDLVPPSLLLNRRHNGVLHERIVFVTVETAEVPRLPRARRAQVEPLGAGFFRVRLAWGFMEEPDIPAALAEVSLDGFRLHPAETSYFLGRESVLSAPRSSGMARWRERLFSWMRRNERPASAYFRIPPDRAVEVGILVEI